MDSGRNKAIAHSQVQVPLFGQINVDILADFTNASVLEYTPFLSLCQKQPLVAPFNLSAFFEEASNASNNATFYLGQTALPWSGGNGPLFNKFETSLNNSIIDTYFDATTGQLAWV